MGGGGSDVGGVRVGEEKKMMWIKCLLGRLTGVV